MTDQDNTSLDKPLTIQEMSEAVWWGMKSGKTPGPGGIPIEIVTVSR